MRSKGLSMCLGGIIVMILILAIGVNAWGQAVVVKAQVDKDVYKVGDTVNLQVLVDQNTGLHSLFFDLAYDGSILAFDSLNQGAMVSGEQRKNEFLYAASDPKTTLAQGSHVIVSYALQGVGAMTPRTGYLCEMKFKVTAPGNPNLRYQFTYNDNAVHDGAGNKITDVLWENSGRFAIGTIGPRAFVLITKPTDMEVVYQNQVQVAVVCTAGADYFLKYENQTTKYASNLLPATQANPPGQMIPITHGYNNINVTLYQRMNNQDYAVATDSLRVYRPEDDQFIKIMNPKDHQLLNTDMVDVIVSSPYAQVTVNGLPATYQEKGNGNQNLYRARLWLKKGFNTVTAEATSPAGSAGAQNVKYKDTIQIYYQKDGSIFSFTLPRVGQFFKPAADSYLRIEGEIDSPYRAGVNTDGGLPAPNTVSLRVIYKPNNYLKGQQVLVDNRLATITESTGNTGAASSRYKFFNDFEIPLLRLGNGEIEIIAYKNLEGDHYDDKVTRVVYVDDNRLWIDLVQPNVYSDDLLDTYQRMLDFNETKAPLRENISISNDGGIVLPAGQPQVKKESLTGVADMATAKDGTLYALANQTASGLMSLYKKGPTDPEWQRILARSQMYGYTLCVTDMGVLVGVSNLSATQESGMYLLQGDQLVNIQFPATLPHVQFIENRQGMIYFYGNYYSYLYSFNIYTLSEGNGGGLKVDALNRASLPNNSNLKQMVLSSDCETAVLRDENNQIQFYNKTDAGYQPVDMGATAAPLTGKNIVAGEYLNGDYNAYLILQDNGAVLSIMEYKKGPRKYFSSNVTLNTWLEADFQKLTAVGFATNDFYFLYQNQTSADYLLKKGQAFFDKFYPRDLQENEDRYQFSAITVPDPARLFITAAGEIFLGTGSGLADSQTAAEFYCFYRPLTDESGTISFNYVNEDLDGLTGFSFEVDPNWLTKDSPVAFSFAVREKVAGASATTPTDKTRFGRAEISLTEWLVAPGDLNYTLSHRYDPATEREVIDVEFNTLQTGCYLSFGFKLRPVGNSSPGVYNLKVHKKIPARICAATGETITIPIHGFIYDRTVTEAIVQQARVPLGPDGSFRYDYVINRSQREIPVAISCVNSAGATARLAFTIEVVNSQNGLGLISYRAGGETPQAFTAPVLSVTNETIILSGKYYGLEGAALGYELYGYQYKNGVESLVLYKRGLFQPTRSDAAFAELGVTPQELGAGYTAGYFENEAISLIPGRQQLRIYCENPGGFRSEFKVDGKYPIIDYNMPAGEQRIVFSDLNLTALTPETVVQNVPIRSLLQLEVGETVTTLADKSKQYQFQRSYELAGEIKSLYSFANLMVKSYNPGLVFENGTTETTVPVTAGNRFTIKVKMTLSDQKIVDDFDIGVIPAIPSLTWLRTGVRFTVRKNFAGACFIPDFSPTRPEAWTEEQKKTLAQIPIRLKFNRADLPVPNCRMTLTVNSDTSLPLLEGSLEPVDGGVYEIRDENNKPLYLRGIKYGKNRIQWVLQYSGGSAEGNSYVINASNMEGMSDEVFDYTATAEAGAVMIGFSTEWSNIYYNVANLPKLSITMTKGQAANATVSLNGIAIKEIQVKNEIETLTDFNLATGDALRQGPNELVVSYTDLRQGTISKTYLFLYDSEDPKVAIASWSFAVDGKTLSELTTTVTETNFEKGYLYYGTDIISPHPEVIMAGADKYLLRWTNLAGYGIIPSGEKPVKVTVYDHAEKSGSSNPNLTSYLQRPDEETAREVAMNLPPYSGDPKLGHESNYQSKPFPEHTIFAPQSFLPQQSVIGQMGEDGDYLVRNIFEQKVTASDGVNFQRRSVAAFGNTVIVGAETYDDKGVNSGSVFIFERNEYGNWTQKQKLTASDGTTGDYFGRKVAIAGDIAIIGANCDDDKGSNSGSAYIFERDGIGYWTQKQKLTASDGAAGDYFGLSVAISGNVVIIGAPDDGDKGDLSGSAYIFERDGNGYWNQKQKLTASDGGWFGEFGASVAISENIAFIGTGTYMTFGSVYVFERGENGNWIQKQKLTNSNGTLPKSFGCSMAISGNVALIGAQHDYDKGLPCGSSYIFERDGDGNWNQKQKLTASDGAEDYFGCSVAISGNVALIGAYYDYDKGVPCGSSYIFERDGDGNWNQKQKLTASDGAAYDYFGYSVTISRNVAIIGASGAAYFYKISVSDQLYIPNDQKYLVFKVAKDPLEIQDKNKVNGNIYFEAVGSEKSLTHGEVVEKTPIKLDLSKAVTIEGYNSVYYIVDLPELKGEFLKNCIFFPAGITTSGYSIYDLGALRVRYQGPLTPDHLTDIYVTGDLTQGLNDILLYDPSYETPGEPTTLTEKMRYPEEQLSYTRKASADTETINFWLRLEDERLGDPDYVKVLDTTDTSLKRVLTISGADGALLLQLSYKGDKLYLYDKDNNSFQQVGILPVAMNFRQWNMITLRITKDKPKLEVRITGGSDYQTCLELDYTTLTRETMTKILAQGTKFVFGPPVGAGYNTGFFSIAGAFYVDRCMSDDELNRIFLVRDKYISTDVNYQFSDSVSDFSDGLAQLRPIGNGAGTVTSHENANAEEFRGQGSLKASSRQRNFLRVKSDEAGNSYVLFGEAGSGVNFNLDLEPGAGQFSLRPRSQSGGRYYFGDKNSNYGLGLDRWYSISGNVVTINETTKAYLVLRINDQEQRWRLKPGRFHFIYDNSQQNTPAVAKLYIETDGPVTLGTDMALNQGNYILPESLERTAAKTFFPFGLSGTVHFWYKPLNANPNGLVNYQATLFDSELIKIGTRLDKEGDAVFYAALKKDPIGAEMIEISTNVKVGQSWQHLQVSYNFKDDGSGIGKSVSFYVNGKLAGEPVNLDGFSAFGSLTGQVPNGDNVWLGCDRDEKQFAEGYLDEITISKYYQKEQYQNRRPLLLAYSEGAKEVNLNLGQGLVTDTLHYTLEALDQSLKEEGSIFPIHMDQKLAGRYRVTADLVIGGHNYREILVFNSDSRPKFRLQERTPLVFRNYTKDLNFKFGYDLSYRFETDQLQYIGLAARITYQENGVAKSQTRYLLQDFRNQNPADWLQGFDSEAEFEWQALKPENGLLGLVFPGITPTSEVKCQFQYFYYCQDGTTTVPGFDSQAPMDLECVIPMAALQLPLKPKTDDSGYEYMLEVNVTGADTGVSGAWNPLLDDIRLEYQTIHSKLGTGTAKSGSASLSKNPENQIGVRLYYDDILSWDGGKPVYGEYTCKLKLIYQGAVYMDTEVKPLLWVKREQVEAPPTTVQQLEIKEFSLLDIDQQRPEQPTASFYLKLEQNGLGTITPTIEVISGERIIKKYDNLLGPGEELNSTQTATKIFTNLGIPKGRSVIKLTLAAAGFNRSREITIDNTVDKPELALTNSVDAEIQYNNVLFSWKGYYHGQFSDTIEYQYNLDNQGWTTPNRQWRSVRFYNLEEGYHTFMVRALYHDEPSEIRQVTFFVDIKAPVFEKPEQNIAVKKLYDPQGVFYAVNLMGAAGAIRDIALEKLLVNGKEAAFQADGSFTADNLLIKTDGTEPIKLTAFDKVGNYTEYTVAVANPITTILFPNVDQRVRYSPLTLTGTINRQITAGLQIYVADCFSPNQSDYSGWKKAKINPDRTFFVEDLFINPGTAEREINTKLRLACVFDNGKTFERELEVRANEILAPIEMKLSTHAVEGENGGATTITIDCAANVRNISTWSIDFDGDGVYDLVEAPTNPVGMDPMRHSWTHKYSSLGLVSPRVRVITKDGDFFSTTQTLIIHEKVRVASFKLMANPIAITTVKLPDESNRLFILRQQDDQSLVEVYEVRRNDTYLSDKLYDIDLGAYEITNPVRIKALDADHLLIAANNEGLGAIYQLTANQFGNYELVSAVNLDDEVADFTLQGQTLLASLNDRATLVRIPLTDGLLRRDGLAYENITLANTNPLREKTGLATDGQNFFVADRLNQRLLQLAPSLGMIDQFGARGNGEGEFIWPDLVRYYENRIFVSDSGRHDLQVFDRNYNSICTLGYRNDPLYENYVEAGFFDDIADFTVIAREEGNRLYYYALILSRSAGKLSMIRLPQWEELKVRVRNNKIVFVKEGELYTAKPDGSDLQKILSSDSLPRIEGSIDYPALAPDGRKLAFTSRIQLYNGAPGMGDPYNIYIYSNLYIVNLDNHQLTQVDLGTMNGYEIERPVFNSGGSQLVFSAKPKGGKWKIYTYDFASGHVAKLFNVDENARFPYFSPDDRYLVFTSDFKGTEEIVIAKVDDPAARIAVTDNNSRDSFPVWSTVYPGEIASSDLAKMIKSKIAFVSERNTHKGVYCVYLDQETADTIAIYDLKNKQVVGDKPDNAALEITSGALEGDYPCFTGDGRNLLFGYYDGKMNVLKKLNFETNLNAMLEGKPRNYDDLDLVSGATRPAGMKNMITNFRAVNRNGNEIALTWDRYTDNDIFYIVQYKPVNGADIWQSYVL
ncbi:MAG TPA: LamG-like jellyroll fold domain-containing protein, partial [Bacillota bacterium]|nr:LamG-like jellyroll fold domain-containing protein [Bacillota bacterium]